MTSIITYIEELFLKPLSIQAQKVWLNTFIYILEEKRKIINSQIQIEEIQNKLLNLELGDEFSAEEIKEAIEHIRSRSHLWTYGKSHYIRTYPVEERKNV